MDSIYGQVGSSRSSYDTGGTLRLTSIFICVMTILLVNKYLSVVFLSPSICLSPILTIYFLSSVNTFSFSMYGRPLSSPVKSLVCPPFLTDWRPINGRLIFCQRRIGLLLS